ncbi:hypothetical protein ABKV19_000753 [Rosa sericea]
MVEGVKNSNITGHVLPYTSQESNSFLIIQIEIDGEFKRYPFFPSMPCSSNYHKQQRDSMLIVYLKGLLFFPAMPC